MVLSVVILCGGEGSRIKPILGSLPKILAPIAHKAFIDYLLEWIRVSLGSIPYDIILATCIGHQKIREYIECNNLDCTLSKEDKPLGTLGAIIDVIQKNNIMDYVLVLNGDTLFEVNLSNAFNVFSADPNVPLLLVKPSKELGRFGGYARFHNGKFRFCKENPEYISLGAFFCSSSNLLIFKDRVPTDPERGMMLDLDFLDQSNINTFVLPPDVSFIDIGVPLDYQLAQGFIPSLFDS